MNILTGATCSNPNIVPILQIVKVIIDVIRIGVPIILIVMGMFDLVKAVTTSKEDEIKKGQKTFITRLIAGIIVFLIVTIVKFVISILPEDLVGAEWQTCINIIFGS